MRISVKLFFLLFLLSLAHVQGQDSIAVNKATSESEITIPSKAIEPKLHSPRRALLLSTFLPGAGQIYNKKYWKAPLIWGGFVALGFSLDFNIFAYRTYRTAYIARTDNDVLTTDTTFGILTDAQVLSNTKFYHRKVNLTFVGFALLYTANLIDAYVDGHLFQFDVGEDIAIHWNPSFYDLSARSFSAGIQLRMNLWK